MQVEIPNSLMLRGENKTQVVVDTTKWSPAFVEYLLTYGWDVRMQRCTAGVKDTAEFQKKEAAMLASMTAGELPHKGGGGLSVSLDDRIATRYLAFMGVKGKTADLETRWETFAKATVLNSIEDATEKAALLKDQTQLAELAVEYLDAVKESAMESSEWQKIRDELIKEKAPPSKPGIKISMKKVK
jgi:hypothetical protein